MGIKIAISGKGGVGKTTVCAVWSQLFAEDGFDVLAIDADPTTNLASAFGISSEQSPEPLIKMKDLIAERTGTGKESISAYFRLNPKVSDLPEKYWLQVSEILPSPLKLLVLGAVVQAGGGCACPEGVFLKALLTNTILQRQEMVFVDLAAGVESMGRASVSGIDALIVVVEPGGRSIEVALNIAKMGKELGIKQVAAVLNKISDEAQIKLIKSQLKGIPILAKIAYSSGIQSSDLQRKTAFDSDAGLVSALKEAKNNLLDLLNTEKPVAD